MIDEHLQELKPSVRRSDGVRRSAGTLYIVRVKRRHKYVCSE